MERPQAASNVMDPRPDRPQQLKRVVNLPLLTLYGLGTTIGAGIYALMGEIAGVAGYGAPLSFLVASVVAGFTACSFAELAGRFPRAAGAALYVQKGLGTDRLSVIVGLMVALAGVVSAAALLNGFAGYVQNYLDFDRAWIIIAAALALGGLAGWGIAQSVMVAAIITVVEVGGLLLVIGAGADQLAHMPARWHEFVPGTGSGIDITGMLVGVTLAFYAFIGFEDMVDVAEEVKRVRVTMPRAILLTLGFSTLLYLLLMVTALLTLTPDVLAAGDAPLARLYEAHTGEPTVIIGVIAMFAIINGALVQIVMASRVLYGLSARGQLPGMLGRVNPGTRTPLVATAAAVVLVLVLALYGSLGPLANTTSLIMLTVFALVNGALWRLKGQSPPPAETYDFPRVLPLLGMVLSVFLVLRELTASV